MTRINLGIAPHELCDQMLLGELREIQRLPALAKKAQTAYEACRLKLLERPTLGKGHVKFFYRYGGSIIMRAKDLRRECESRGFKATSIDWMSQEWPPTMAWFIPDYVYDDFIPVIRTRINDNLKAMKRTPTWTGRKRPDWVTL